MFAQAGFEEAVALAETGADRTELHRALPSDAAHRVGLVGDAALVREKLEAYAAAGLDEVVLVPATDGDPGGERTLTAFADLRSASVVQG